MAPNCCAVSAAQAPMRSRTNELPCSTTVDQEREFSVRIATTLDLCSTVIEINLLTF
jgi:hypothetical protein